MNLHFKNPMPQGFKLLLLAILFATANIVLFAQTPSARSSVGETNQITTAPAKNFPNVRIKNFGQMDQKFYRGAQPKKEDYESLKSLGVKTVIDLRDDPTDYEKPAVEALGMRYINIPMSDKNYPSESSISEFLKLAGDPQTGILFVHCEGGRHRTGVIGAVYRMTKYHWSFEQAYQEMKNYDFYTRWGHGAMKDFVVDYAAKITARQE